MRLKLLLVFLASLLHLFLLARCPRYLPANHNLPVVENHDQSHFPFAVLDNVIDFGHDSDAPEKSSGKFCLPASLFQFA